MHSAVSTFWSYFARRPPRPRRCRRSWRRPGAAPGSWPAPSCAGGPSVGCMVLHRPHVVGRHRKEEQEYARLCAVALGPGADLFDAAVARLDRPPLLVRGRYGLDRPARPSGRHVRRVHQVHGPAPALVLALLDDLSLFSTMTMVNSNALPPFDVAVYYDTLPRFRALYSSTARLTGALRGTGMMNRTPSLSRAAMTATE